MTVASVVNAVFQCILIPILTILAKSVVSFFEKEKVTSEKTAKDKAIKHATEMLSDIILDCVAATNQTYVNSLKEQGKFDLDAQQKALDLTKSAVLDVLSDELRENLTDAFGDLNTYLSQKIESTVGAMKKIGQK